MRDGPVQGAGSGPCWPAVSYCRPLLGALRDHGAAWAVQARTVPQSFCSVPPTPRPQHGHLTGPLTGAGPGLLIQWADLWWHGQAVQEKSRVGTKCEDSGGKRRVQGLESGSHPCGCWSCVIWGFCLCTLGGPAALKPLLTKMPAAPLSCDNPRLSPDGARHPGGGGANWAWLRDQEPLSQWDLRSGAGSCRGAGPLSVAPGISVLPCLPLDTSFVPVAWCGCLPGSL